MGDRAEALNEVDAEVEARKLRLRGIKADYSRRNGRDVVPADVLEEVIPAAETCPQPTPRQQQLLDAAEALGYVPGGKWSSSALAEKMGIAVSNVYAITAHLHKKGLWPFGESGKGRPRVEAEPKRPEYPALRAAINQGTERKPLSKQAEITRRPMQEPSLREPDPEPYRNVDPKADAECLVIQRVLVQLERLPTPRAKRRVLLLLADRLDEETGEPWA